MEAIYNKLTEISNDLKTKASSEEIQTIQVLLNQKEERISALEQKVEKLTDEVVARDEALSKLEKRVDQLLALSTSNSAHLDRIYHLHGRKIDEQEQRSRKVNLRINGVVNDKNETPASLLAMIKSECAKLDLGLVDADFDHCHRNGKIHLNNGVNNQTILVKMGSFNARDKVYQKRKRFPFKVGHDLTVERQNLLSAASDLIKSDKSVQETVEFVLADRNCKIKLKSKDGRYHHFNSLDEFTSVVMKIQNNKESERFRKEEKHDELFY